MFRGSNVYFPRPDIDIPTQTTVLPFMTALETR